MGSIDQVNSTTVNELLFQLAAAQKQLIETQQALIKSQKQVIRLQNKLDKQAPKNPKEHDAHWHIASGGIMSLEAANSKDLAIVRKFEEWNIQFAEKYIKPHVSPKVFSECVHQMTRGLPERIATLETQDELRALNNGHKAKANSTASR